ncbi:hypothetical protein D3C81_2271770 [compost metagenome]
MQQIPVLMEPVMTHLLHIEHPQHTYSKMVALLVRTDQRKERLIGLVLEAAFNN